MILYYKTNKIFSEKEIKEIFPIITARKIIYSRDIVTPDCFIKYCSFKKIDYTFQDFLKDYPKFRKYKSPEIMFKIYEKGYTVLKYRNENNISSHLEKMIKYGLDFNTTIQNAYKLINLLGYNIDTSKFEIDKYETHVELFGKKEHLKAFKEKYGIRYDIIYEPYKKSWHLAFNGMLADYIRIYK